MLAFMLLVLVYDAGTTPPVKTNCEAYLLHAEDELEALDALVDGTHASGAWRRVHDLYRECPEHSENSASETWGWVPATLLAKHWILIHELHALAVKDPAWMDFVFRRLHGPIDPKLLRRAAANTKSCPKSARQLCERIHLEALQAAQEVEAENNPTR